MTSTIPNTFHIFLTLHLKPKNVPTPPFLPPSLLFSLPPSLPLSLRQLVIELLHVHEGQGVSVHVRHSANVLPLFVGDVLEELGTWGREGGREGKGGTGVYLTPMCFC